MKHNTVNRFWTLVLLLMVSTMLYASQIDLDASSKSGQSCFDLDDYDYVKHWLVAGPDYKPYDDGQADSRAEMPESVAIDAPGPFGKPWQYLSLGDDSFIELGERVAKPSTARMYFAVDLDAPKDLNVEARMRIGDSASIRLNGDDLGNFHGNSARVRLKLRKGLNRFVAIIQDSGELCVHLGMGLQIPGQTGRVRVRLPGPREATAELVRAEAWMRGIRMSGPNSLVSDGPPPFPAQALLGTRHKRKIEWQPGQTELCLPSGDAPLEEISAEEQMLNLAFAESRKALMVVVETHVRGQVLSRAVEIPPARPLVLPDPTPSLEAHSLQYIKRLPGRFPSTTTGFYDTYFVEGIVRWMLGEPPVHGKARLEASLQRIDQRIDCADFDLTFALRFYRLGAGAEEDRRRIRESALKFRYWNSDPGNDVMVFHGENHPLLFHCNELIAGNLWPDDVFTNTGKTGREHARLGLKRCLEYLDKLESEGYEEFLSTTYVAITTGGLMNLLDFSDDEDISRRAARQVDKIYRMLAEHTFDGLMLGPQGRTARRMLYPQALASQSFMSYATPKAVETFDPWVISVASSPRYRPPEALDESMASTIRKQYREAYFFINLNKTPDYMLSSVEISAAAKDPSYTQQRIAGGHGYQWHRSLVPGGRGYQQHVWHASLARDCHVFTTHPGSSRDLGDGTPGFWTGNGAFPRQTQNGNTLMQIFSIPEDHPVQFTHAYWPSNTLDEQRIEGHWAFGRKNKGFIALWCSVKPTLRSEALVNRELRAWGDRMAWICVCSSESESGDFDTFIRRCERLTPKFDRKNLSLRVKGQKPVKWDDGAEIQQPTTNNHTGDSRDR